MEEHRDQTPSEDRPPHEDTPPPASDHPEPVERRSFFRRSAEVAALSLFGVGGLDPLIDRVAARVAERMGGDRLASEVARRLSESGVMMPRAHAATSTPECPSDFAPPPGGPAPGGVELPQWLCPTAPNFTCDPDYACNANTRPKFQGCLYPDFYCQWGLGEHKFHCHLGAALFDCATGFSCPPWDGGTAWFYCKPGTDPPFECDYPDDFHCGPEGDGFLCPTHETYFHGCDYSHWNPWLCAPGSQFGKYCVEPSHQCIGMDYFGCSQVAPAGFSCEPPATAFSCGGGTQTFSCDNSKIYDFTCYVGFSCLGGAETGFDCTSNHQFFCRYSAFQCSGGPFTCSAGGNRCGAGMTGSYDYDQPGDYGCFGGATGTKFECAEGLFSCHAADDFQCGWGTSFTCKGRFAGCSPGPGGKFECNWDFECEPFGGETFNCGQADHKCVSDGRQFSSDDE
jgi:hypothetical protein